MQSKPIVFLDASVLVSAALSKTGASRIIIGLAGNNFLRAIISPSVVQEARDALVSKYSKDELAELYKLVALIKKDVGEDASDQQKRRFGALVDDPKDRHVLGAALRHKAQYLLTLDRKHFFTDRLKKADLLFKIMLPGDFLKEYRAQIEIASR